MKKNDCILFIVVLICAVLFYVGYNLHAEQGDIVTVTISGEFYGSYNLNTDQVVYIEDTNVLQILNGEAYMIEATCPDGLCLNQSAIHQSKECIICLPNEVIVEATSQEESEYDAIVQ